jgi:hypothetical protein
MTKVILEYVIVNDKISTLNVINKKDPSATIIEKILANTLEEYFIEIKEKVFPNNIQDILSEIGKN